MATRLWGFRDGKPWMLNPLVGSAGLAGGSLAVWNPRGRRRKRRRGNTMARRRRSGRFAPASRRRRRSNAPRRRRSRTVVRHVLARRRNQPPVPFINRPRRRRAGVGFLPGLPPIAQMLPPVAAGIGGGFMVGWGGPMAATWFGVPPVGFMYRLIQAGVAWVGAWALGSFRVVDRATAVAFGTGGSVVAGLGLVSDWQRGLVGGFPGAAAVAPAAAVEGLGQEEEYDAMMGYYEPYGVGPTMGYYEAVA